MTSSRPGSFKRILGGGAVTKVSAEVMWLNTGDSVLPTTTKWRRIEEEDRLVEVMRKRLQRETPITGTNGTLMPCLCQRSTGWSPRPYPLQRLT